MRPGPPNRRSLELLARILAAAIGVIQQGVRPAASPNRHQPGIGDKLGRHGGTHRPSDHAQGEQINLDGNVQPSLRRPGIGKFVEQRAMELKVSNRFTVPICRLHHRELHPLGSERAWWESAGIDPLGAAATLWGKAHAVEPAAVIAGDRPMTSGKSRPTAAMRGSAALRSLKKARDGHGKSGSSRAHRRKP
jgi:hypothetical protein